MDDATRTSTTIALCHICTIKNPLSLSSVMQVVKNLLSLKEIQHKGVREPCKMSYGCKLSNANLSRGGTYPIINVNVDHRKVHQIMLGFIIWFFLIC
jgi:hypothetical protein